jgi:hypothetical protein
LKTPVGIILGNDSMVGWVYDLSRFGNREGRFP